MTKAKITDHGKSARPRSLAAPSTSLAASKKPPPHGIGLTDHQQETIRLQTSIGNRAVLRYHASRTTTPEVDAAVAGLGDGRPLDSTVREWFERRLACDLGAVRIHHAPDAARAFGARAFTAGNDVVFADATPAPAIVAHELAHVSQHGGTEAGRPLVLGERGDDSEREANRISAALMRGEPVLHPIRRFDPAIVRRDDPGVHEAIEMGPYLDFLYPGRVMATAQLKEGALSNKHSKETAKKRGGKPSAYEDKEYSFDINDQKVTFQLWKNRENNVITGQVVVVIQGRYSLRDKILRKTVAGKAIKVIEAHTNQRLGDTGVEYKSKIVYNVNWDPDINRVTGGKAVTTTIRGNIYHATYLGSEEIGYLAKLDATAGGEVTVNVYVKDGTIYIESSGQIDARATGALIWKDGGKTRQETLNESTAIPIFKKSKFSKKIRELLL